MPKDDKRRNASRKSDKKTDKKQGHDDQIE